MSGDGTERETLEEAVAETQIHPKEMQRLDYVESALSTQITLISQSGLMEEPTTLIRCRDNIRAVIDAANRSVDTGGERDV